LEPNLGDFVVFEVPIKVISGIAFLPTYGQGLVSSSSKLGVCERLRGAVCALLPSRKMAVVLRMDDESEVEIVEFRYVTVVSGHELTASERDFMFRFNRDKLLVNQGSSRP
jgi:hypothetical protein